MKFANVQKTDPEVYGAIVKELDRQRNVVELIASENIVSKAVLETVGSHLTNKYSEGMPFKRYYGGNDFIDITEDLARQRAMKLFGAEHANVQPHSGSQANAEAYFAMLELKDKILAMDLSHGGHLTHGSPVSFSGKFYDFIHYGIDKETEQIDIDAVRKIALAEKPKMIVAGASAYPRFIDFKPFREIADEIGAYLMVDMAHIAGPIAAKLHPDPVPYADVITTTTHKTLRGPRGAMILCKTEDRFRPDDKKNLAQKIDFSVFPGMQGGPLDHVIAGKAVAFFEALQPSFVTYQKQVMKNAKVLSDTLMDNGFRLISGGTDIHLLLLDMTNKNLTGKEAEVALDQAGICTNKNMIPFDTRSPFNPSGVRLGTPAITTRGMKEEEMKQIGEWINKVISNPNDEVLKASVREEVMALMKQFPIYEGF